MKLSKREQFAVALAAVVMIAFAVIRLGVFPMIEKHRLTQRGVEARAEALKEINVLKAQYDELRQKARMSEGRFARRESGFTLFSFLDRLAGEAGIKDHITYMKPSRSEDKDTGFRISLVEMKLQDVNMEQLMPYLHMVETSENVVFIRRMSITRTGRDEAFIDAVLQVETYEI